MHTRAGSEKCFESGNFVNKMKYENVIRTGRLWRRTRLTDVSRVWYRWCCATGRFYKCMGVPSVRASKTDAL
jgi:hypothetical protein